LGAGEGAFDVVSAKESGIFLHRTYLGIENNALNLVFLDTALETKWSGFVPLDKNFVLTKSLFYENSLYVLLRNNDFSQSDLQIAIINKEKGTYTVHAFKNFIPLQISQFKVTSLSAIIGGYFNRMPVVIYYSFAEKKSKIVRGLFNETGELDQIRTYDDGTFDVVVSAKNIHHQQTIIIRNYDAEGGLVKNVTLQPEVKRELIFARSLKTGNDTQLVGGVYGKRKRKISKGVFLASIGPEGNDELKYHAYADLENFFKFMKAKRERRVKEQIMRRKVKGRNLRFNYRFIVHEIVPYKNQYIMLGEAFYQKYYYTHAVVIGFDNNANLLWDNSFEINDVRTFYLDQFVKLDIRPDHITLLYLFDQQIRSKIINNNQVVEGKTIDPIKLKYDTDYVKKNGTSTTKLDYWFEHHFYASGIQNVNYASDSLTHVRRVFFVNKVTTR
jgi:hypothetical protein